MQHSPLRFVIWTRLGMDRHGMGMDMGGGMGTGIAGCRLQVGMVDARLGCACELYDVGKGWGMGPAATSDLVGFGCAGESRERVPPQPHRTAPHQHQHQHLQSAAPAQCSLRSASTVQLSLFAPSNFVARVADSSVVQRQSSLLPRWVTVVHPQAT